MFKDFQGERFESDPERQSFVWDALTASIFLDPSIATNLEDRYVDMDVLYGPNYGRSLGYHESCNRFLENPGNAATGTQRASILFDVDREAFWNQCVDLMTRPVNAEEVIG